MGNIITITTDEQIQSAEYKDYRDIQKAVGGCFDILKSSRFYLNQENDDYISLQVHCNDEALLIDSEEFSKILLPQCHTHLPCL